MRAADLLPVGTLVLRSRRLRAALSGLGIAIGIASMVAVLGVTRSSESQLLAQIDRLGTNLLTVVNGQSLDGAETELPATAAPMIGHTPDVLQVAPTAQLVSANVYRSDHVPAGQGGGLAVRACDSTLLATLDGSLLAGHFLDSGRYPVTVLGHDAARTLGIGHFDSAGPLERVAVGVPRATTGLDAQPTDLPCCLIRPERAAAPAALTGSGEPAG
jgi:putative ABC transport system permease protein